MEDLFTKRFPVLRNVARKVLAFEMLPQPFYGVEVRAVGREVDWLDVMPVEPLGLVPAGVVENEQDPFAFFPGSLGDNGVEECLEDFRVKVRDDEADELAACGVHRADDVPAQMSTVVALDGTGAAPHPFVRVSAIYFGKGSKGCGRKPPTPLRDAKPFP